MFFSPECDDLHYQEKYASHQILTQVSLMANDGLTYEEVASLYYN